MYVLHISHIYIFICTCNYDNIYIYVCTHPTVVFSVLESPRRHGVLQALQTRIRDATQVGSFRWVFVAWGLVGTVAISRGFPHWIVVNSGLKPRSRSWKPSAWKMGLENDSWALAMAIQRSCGCWQEREFLTLLMQRPVMDARINSMCSMCLGTSPMVLIGHGSMLILFFSYQPQLCTAKHHPNLLILMVGNEPSCWHSC